MSKKKDTVSVIVRPTRQFMARLDALAHQYKRESANQLIVEIAELYTERWVELEQARLDMFKQQWERMREMLKQPIYSAEAEQSSKSQAPQKKGRR